MAQFWPEQVEKQKGGGPQGKGVFHIGSGEGKHHRVGLAGSHCIFGDGPKSLGVCI